MSVIISASCVSPSLGATSYEARGAKYAGYFKEVQRKTSYSNEVQEVKESKGLVMLTKHSSRLPYVPSIHGGVPKGQQTSAWYRHEV